MTTTVMKSEYIGIAAILFLIAIALIGDLIGDFQTNSSWWHLFIEGGAGLLALGGAFQMLRQGILLREALRDAYRVSAELEQSAADWRARARRYIEGLSKTIDDQLNAWHLTPAEKEVAFLLLKGMSLKEIAEIRGSAEKTARVHSAGIYSKSGLSGRSELSAFFLEELLSPTSEIEGKKA